MALGDQLRSLHHHSILLLSPTSRTATVKLPFEKSMEISTRPFPGFSIALWRGWSSSMIAEVRIPRPVS
jgi:hypothetical protein